MSGYVEGGYVVVIGSLFTYASSLLWRERTARRRLPSGEPPEADKGPDNAGDITRSST